jgi:phenylpropionate dioxygenase-like ring-hydroxylating dioxygenase large terminal subunit
MSGLTASLPDLIAKQRPGYPLDGDFYRDPEVFERDMEKIFLRSWLCVGHISQVPEPGDFFLFEVGEESLIIVRDRKRELHALINVCRHRGSRVCTEPSGNVKGLVCPYHGWAYDLAGNLRSKREMPEGFDRAQHALKRARLQVFHGMIFVNFWQGAPDLQGALARLDPCLTPYRLADAVVAHRELYAMDANWKLAVENFMECYHCAPSHPEFSRGHSRKAPPADSEEERRAMLKRAAELGLVCESVFRTGSDAEPDDVEMFYDRQVLLNGYVTGSPDGQPVAPLLGDLEGYDGAGADIQIGPVSFGLLYADHAVLYRFTPRAPQKTDMEVVWLVNSNAREGVDYDLQKLTWLWRVTSDADERIILNNQKGVNSRYYEPGPYSEMENYAAGFVDLYLHWIK